MKYLSLLVERAGCECRGSSQLDVPVNALNQFGLFDFSYSFSVSSIGRRLLRPLNQSLTQQQVPARCFRFVIAYPASQLLALPSPLSGRLFGWVEVGKFDITRRRNDESICQRTT